MKQISANKPLLVPADAAGLKFRVQPSDVLVAQMEALGANPQKMAFSEVYGALQTGVVDGQENTWSNVYGQKFFEVQDGTTETNHGVIDYLVVTSAEWWDGLPDEVRDQLKTILDEVTEERNAASNAVDLDAKQAMIDAGGEVRTLTPEQRALWVNAMKPVWSQFEALDANPQKMAFSEVYGALQTGVVDGQENTWSNVYGQKFFEVQDGTTETNHGVIDYLVVTSTKWWDGLPDDVRSQLKTILEEVTAERNAESNRVDLEAKC
jgi:TRAP-type C4-dicarboxylate transport system substrate-binding protein